LFDARRRHPERARRAGPRSGDVRTPSRIVRRGGAIAGVDTGPFFIENGRFHGEKIIEVIAAAVD